MTNSGSTLFANSEEGKRLSFHFWAVDLCEAYSTDFKDFTGELFGWSQYVVYSLLKATSVHLRYLSYTYRKEPSVLLSQKKGYKIQMCFIISSEEKFLVSWKLISVLLSEIIMSKCQVTKKNLLRIFEGRNVRHDGIYGEKLLDFLQNVIVGANN